MYLMYVDESGDTGAKPGSSRHFVLSGVVVHEASWLPTLDAMLAFKRKLRAVYGIGVRTELHGADLIQRTKNPALIRLKKYQRLLIYRDTLEFMAQQSALSIINIFNKKKTPRSTQGHLEITWGTLFQRLHNTVKARNFPGPGTQNDRAIVITDPTDIKRVRALLRKRRRWNPVPSKLGTGYRQLPLDRVIEDPEERDSVQSWFVQLADIAVTALGQYAAPCGYVKKKGARYWFRRLRPILCTVAQTSHPDGIVVID